MASDLAAAEWAVAPLRLDLRSSFGTSHSSTSSRTNAAITFRAGGSVGHGEVGLPPKKPGCYEADLADVEAFVAALAGEAPADGDSGRSPFGSCPDAAFPRLRADADGGAPFRAAFAALDRVAARRAGDRSSKAALCGAEMALLDAWCSRAGVSLAAEMAAAGAGGRRPEPRAPPRSFFTVAMNDDMDAVVAAAEFGLRHTPLLKLKLDASVERAERVLAAVLPLLGEDGRLSIDANAAWTPAVANKFLALLTPLAGRVYMVEQPFPLYRAAPGGAGGVVEFLPGGGTREVNEFELAAWRAVRDAYGARGLRIFGDESVGARADVEALEQLMHGVNVKLEKAGGLRGALDTMAAADSRGLLTWVGIMVSGAVNTTAAACALPLASSGYGDVDGTLLVTPECQTHSPGFGWAAGGEIILAAAAGGLNAAPLSP